MPLAVYAMLVSGVASGPEIVAVNALRIGENRSVDVRPEAFDVVRGIISVLPGNGDHAPQQKRCKQQQQHRALALTFPPTVTLRSYVP